MSRNQVLYVSGVHGSGKSTLIKSLLKDYPDRYLLAERFPIPKSQEVMDRERIRFARYFLMTFQEDELARKNPGMIILVDRCALDNIAYLRGFARHGWLSEADARKGDLFYDYFFSPDRRPEHVAFMNPSLKHIQRNIAKRWEKTGIVKWREKDFEYLEAVWKSFQELYASIDARVVEVHEDSLDERVRKVHAFTTTMLDSKETK